MTTATAEWRANWPLIFTTVIGSTCTGQHVYSLGVVMKPLTDTFGWSRADVSATVTLSGLATVFLAPFVGALVTRHGSRAVAIVAVPLSALTFAAVGFTGPSIWGFWGVFLVYAIVQVAIGPVVWASAVTSTFKVSQGLALGIGLSGTGFASIVYPRGALWLLEHFGWQGVFFGLGAVTFVTLLPLVLLVFRPTDLALAEPESKGIAEPAWGPTLGAVVRTTLFWRVVVMLTTAAVVISSINIHMLPLLTDQGVTPSRAATVVGVIGVSTLAGRWIGGFLLDRIHARWIAIVFFLLPAGGCVLLANFSGSYNQALLAALMIGISYGVEGDMLPYLISRYFGQRHYGTIFGLTMSFFGLGYALAPLAAGAVFDAVGSYDAALVALAGMLMVAAMLAATLARYPAETDPKVGKVTRPA